MYSPHSGTVERLASLHESISTISSNYRSLHTPNVDDNESVNIGSNMVRKISLALAMAIAGLTASHSFAAEDQDLQMEWRIGGLKVAGSTHAGCTPSYRYAPPATTIYQEGHFLRITVDGAQVDYWLVEGLTARAPTIQDTYPYWMGSRQEGYTDFSSDEFAPGFSGYGDWSVLDMSSCTLEAAAEYIDTVWTY